MPVRAHPTPLLVFLLAASVSSAAAQTPPVEGPLPQEVRASVLEYLNAPAVVRMPGGARIPSGTAIEGDIAVLDGPLQVGGEVTGRLVVVNGDLHLLPGAAISGQVLVVGGNVSGVQSATLGDDLDVFAGPLRYRVRDGTYVAIPEEGIAPGFLASDLGFGSFRVTFRTGPGYNRVEGLPVQFGPIIRTAGANPLTLEAFGIWRSVSGLSLSSEELGYSFRLEQAVGGRGTAFLGAAAHSEITPIERRNLSNVEASFSTFLLHQDLRDYYNREGWSAFARVAPARLPLEGTLAYRDEDHRTESVRNPWALRGGDQPWRPLPLIAEGRFRSVEANLSWDSRDDPALPSDGWWIELGVRRQVGGALQLPSSSPGGGVSQTETGGEGALFTSGALDLRRYSRVGPSSRLNLRAMVAGSFNEPLPPQLQLAPGGEGTLPGHPRFALDCGARAETRVFSPGETAGDPDFQTVYPAYGCDRAALVQIEFQGALPFSWNAAPEEWEGSELSSLLHLQPVWAVFLNAGRGWALDDPEAVVPRTDSPTRADLGVGLFVGPLGLYWSYPLNRQDRGLNFFVRLQQRF